jgi:hypothetical protein
LSTLAELTTFRFRIDLNPPTVGSEWTDTLSGPSEAVTLTMNGGVASATPAAGPFTFRCVAPGAP